MYLVWLAPQALADLVRHLYLQFLVALEDLLLLLILAALWLLEGLARQLNLVDPLLLADLAGRVLHHFLQDLVVLLHLLCLLTLAGLVHQLHPVNPEVRLGLLSPVDLAVQTHHHYPLGLVVPVDQELHHCQQDPVALEDPECCYHLMRHT